MRKQSSISSRVDTTRAISLAAAFAAVGVVSLPSTSYAASADGVTGSATSAARPTELTFVEATSSVPASTTATVSSASSASSVDAATTAIARVREQSSALASRQESLTDSTASAASRSQNAGARLRESMRPTTAPAITASTGSGLNSFLLCVRHRESRGDYTAVNRSSGAGGAFQFLPSTWRNVVVHAGRPDLLSVLPQQASPADQDAMAIHLYNWMGRSPWAGPGC